jgi:hypothetical protein
LVHLFAIALSRELMLFGVEVVSYRFKRREQSLGLPQ